MGVPGLVDIARGVTKFLPNLLNVWAIRMAVFSSLDNRSHKPFHGLVGRAFLATVPAAELSIVVGDDDVQTGDHPHRAGAAVAERPVTTSGAD